MEGIFFGTSCQWKDLIIQFCCKEYLFLSDRNGISFMVNSTVKMEVAPKVMVVGSRWTVVASVPCGGKRELSQRHF